MSRISWRAIRGSEVLGLSLTELMLLLTFALLLVLQIFYSDLQEARAVNKDFNKIEEATRSMGADTRTASSVLLGRPPVLNNTGNEDHSRSFSAIAAGATTLKDLAAVSTTEEAQRALAGRSLPEVWTQLVQAAANEDQLKKLAQELARLKKTLVERDARIADLEARTMAPDELVAEMRRLKANLADCDAKVSVAVQTAASQAKRATALEQEVKQLITQLNVLKQKSESLETRLATTDTSALTVLQEKLSNVTGQLANLRQRCGRDQPPCWATEAGDIEYIYTVNIRENDFTVEPAWPANRIKQLNEVDAPPFRQAVTLGENEFRQSMMPLYKWGVREENSCRFFVNVVDRTNTKEGWKRGLRTVESFFYKRELR